MRATTLRHPFTAIAAALALLLVAAPVPSTAQQADDSGAGVTPPRLAVIDGDVSFWRPGSEDWVAAAINTPLSAGDAVYTGDRGNAAIEIGPGTGVRLGNGTELEIATLERGFLQVKISAGRAALDLRQMPGGQTIEVDTPNAAFTIDHPGYYRVDVNDQTTNFVTRYGGTASLTPAGGEDTDVGPDQLAVVTGTDTTQVTTNPAPPPDEFDRLDLEPARAPAQSESRRYVPQNVAGAEDLDRYGSWRDTPDYGHVWAPSNVGPDWSPYSTGRWVWDPYYGWTWVDEAPWGWAPYHYGRWVYADSYWGWAPGPVVGPALYSPALVAFFGGAGVGVSVSVGLPFVSWVALGWGEPVIPWWGAPGFVGHCWWGGWHGPHVVNNVVIDNRTYVNVRNVNVYRNVGARNGVRGVPGDRFGRGPMEHHPPVDPRTLAHLRPVRGQLPVRPARESLVPKPVRGPRPPEHVLSRQVVARHQPQDVTPRLRAAGLGDHGRPGATPPPRLVRPIERPGGRGEAQRAAAPPPLPHQRAGGAPGPRAGGGQARPGTLPNQGMAHQGGRNAVGAPPPPRQGGNAAVPRQREAMQPRDRGDHAPHTPAPPAPDRQRTVDVPRATPSARPAPPRTHETPPASPYGRDQGSSPRRYDMRPPPTAYSPAHRDYSPAPRTAAPPRGAGAPMRNGGAQGGAPMTHGGPPPAAGAPPHAAPPPHAPSRPQGHPKGEPQAAR